MYLSFICFLIQAGLDIPPLGELRTHEWSEAMQVHAMHGVHVIGASQASRKVFFPPENLQKKQNEKRKPGACCSWIKGAVAGLQERCLLCLVLSLIKWERAMQKHKGLQVLRGGEGCEPPGRCFLQQVLPTDIPCLVFPSQRLLWLSCASFS